MIEEKLSVVGGVIKDPNVFREKLLEVVGLYGLDNVLATRYERCIQKGLVEGVFNQEDLNERNKEYLSTERLRPLPGWDYAKVKTDIQKKLMEDLITRYLDQPDINPVAPE